MKQKIVILQKMSFFVWIFFSSFTVDLNKTEMSTFL